MYTKASFIISEEKLPDIDYENLGIKPPEEATDFLSFRFNIKYLVAYNINSLNMVTIRMLSGETFTLNVSFKEFDEFFVKQCKKKWYQII